MVGGCCSARLSRMAVASSFGENHGGGELRVGHGVSVEEAE